jgi:hypothetical protein
MRRRGVGTICEETSYVQAHPVRCDGSDSGQQAPLGSRETAQWIQAELVLVAVMPLLVTTLWAG